MLYEILTAINLISGGIGDALEALKTIVDNLIQFVKWFPSMNALTNMIISTAIPSPFVGVVSIIFVIYVLKLFMGASNG